MNLAGAMQSMKSAMILSFYVLPETASVLTCVQHNGFGVIQEIFICSCFYNYQKVTTSYFDENMGRVGVKSDTVNCK